MPEKVKSILFYVSFFFFVLAFNTTVKNYDYDLWARLIAGMGFFQTGHVIKEDFLSYTPTHIWYDHEWGSSVIFYVTQHFFSSAGILILQSVLIFLIFFFISKIVKLRGVKSTTPYNFLFYYFAYISMSYLLNVPIRCQLFSFLFFTIFIYIMERSRSGVSKDVELYVSLPLLMLLWNNLHGGCVSGIGLIVIYLVGEFFNRKPIKKFAYALLLCLAVLPINPWGFGYLKFLLQANTMNRSEVIEWAGLFSQYFVKSYFKFKIFALVLILIEGYVVVKQIKSKVFEFDKTKFLLVLTTLFLSVLHVKLIPFAVIAMSCFIYDDFYTFVNGIAGNFLNKIANVKDALVYLVILLFVVVNVNKQAFEPLISWSKYPVRAVEFLKINNIKGNLLTSFGQGSYVSYKLYPNNKIFMDGRYEEVYQKELIFLLKDFYLGGYGWDRVLNLYPTDIIIIEKICPVFDVLKKHSSWRFVFDDKFFAVFVRSKIALKSYKTPSDDIKYYKRTLFDTNVNFVLQSKNEQT